MHKEIPISFTAVFLKNAHGYVGFVEERAQSAELLEGKHVVREEFRIPVPRQ